MDPVSAANDLKAELEGMSRLTDARNQIHHAIMHLGNRQELFDRVCEVTVEWGGFRLAYVGWIDERTQQVVPVAKYGNHTAYLDSAPMLADARPRGQGPTGQAIRTGRPYICNDFFNDPATEAWYAAAAEHGFRSSGTFPIRQEGRVAGVIGFYAGEVGYFREREIRLLEEAANDISFALDNFLREERRIKAEEGARRLAAIVESSLDAIISEDMQGTILTWNAAAEQMYGYRANEAIGQPVFMLVPEDKRKETEELLVQVRSGRSFTGVETERVHKSGRHFPVSIMLSPVRDVNGTVIGVSKIAHDISEQMASVAAARESTGLLKVLIEEAPTGLAMFDREMRMLACSRRWKSDRGLSDIEVVGWTHAELDPTIPEHWKEEERRALAGETIISPQDFYKRHDGQVRWLSRTLRPWMTGTGEIGGIVILSEDITERKLAEMALAEEAARTRLLFEQATDSIFLLDDEFRVVEANAAFAALVGRPLNKVLGLHPWDWDPDHFSKDAFAAFAAMLSKEPMVFEGRVVRPDGSVLDTDVSTMPAEWGGRRLIFCIARDITARKQAEAALADEAARTQLLFGKASDSMFLLDDEFKVVEANTAFAALLGRPLDQVYGLHPWEWDPDRPTSGSLANIAVQVPTTPMTFEGRVKSLDGSVREVEASTTPTEWGGRRLIFNVVRDITARKQAEAARREAEEQLRRVIDSMDEGLFIINTEGELLSWNPAARRILGIPDEGFDHVELARYPEFITVFAPDGSVLPPEEWPIVRALRGERIDNQEIRTRSKYLNEDRMISYSSSIVETGDGKKLAFLRCQDVTARWRAENALRGPNT